MVGWPGAGWLGAGGPAAGWACEPAAGWACGPAAAGRAGLRRAGRTGQCDRSVRSRKFVWLGPPDDGVRALLGLLGQLARGSWVRLVQRQGRSTLSVRRAVRWSPVRRPAAATESLGRLRTGRDSLYRRGSGLIAGRGRADRRGHRRWPGLHVRRVRAGRSRPGSQAVSGPACGGAGCCARPRPVVARAEAARAVLAQAGLIRAALGRRSGVGRATDRPPVRSEVQQWVGCARSSHRGGRLAAGSALRSDRPGPGRLAVRPARPGRTVGCGRWSRRPVRPDFRRAKSQARLLDEASRAERPALGLGLVERAPRSGRFGRGSAWARVGLGPAK